MTATLEKPANGNIYEASREWASRPNDQRFETLEELSASVNGRMQRSFQRDYSLDNLTVIEHGENDLRILADQRQLRFSNYSFSQLSQTVKAPAAYLRTLPAELAARNLNVGLDRTLATVGQRNANKLLMTRPVDSEDSIELASQLRAVTSPTYGRIWDADVVKLAVQIQHDHPEFHNPLAYAPDGTGIKAAGLYASDHDVFVFMIDGGSLLELNETHNYKPAKLSRGFFLKNSETGACTMEAWTFLYNFICGNHIIWSAEDISRLVIRHTKGGPGRFAEEALPQLLSHVNRSVGREQAALETAREYLLPKEDAELFTLGAKFSLTRSEIREGKQSAEREEGDCRTLWQLVQGLTAHAREMVHTDSRVHLEKRAGKMLDLALAKSSAPVTVVVD